MTKKQSWQRAGREEYHVNMKPKNGLDGHIIPNMDHKNHTSKVRKYHTRLISLPKESHHHVCEAQQKNHKNGLRQNHLRQVLEPLSI
jgi:hypothetical protein